MTIVAERFAFVVGVDTHARSNTYAIITTRTGAPRCRHLPNQSAGDRPGLEVDHAPMPRKPTASRGRRDRLLWGQYLRSGDQPGSCGQSTLGLWFATEPGTKGRHHRRRAHRAFAYWVAMKPLCADQGQMMQSGPGCGWWPGKSLTPSAPAPSTRLPLFRARSAWGLMDARRPLTKSQIATVAKWKARNEDLGIATARAESIRLARKIASIEEELDCNRQELATLVASSVSAHLLDEVGIGAINAATILVNWSHGGRPRLRSRLSREPVPFPHPPATPSATGLTAEETAGSTGRSHPSL